MIQSQLHTQTLKQKYGKITAVVVRHDPVDHDGERVRISKLVDANGTLRTYAVTLLNGIKPSASDFPQIEREIEEGALIGETFQKHGYTVTRKVLDTFAVPLPRWMQNEFQTSERNANAQLIAFYVEKEGQPSWTYGTLLEICTPDFESPSAESSEHAHHLRNKIMNLMKDDAA